MEWKVKQGSCHRGGVDQGVTQRPPRVRTSSQGEIRYSQSERSHKSLFPLLSITHSCPSLTVHLWSDSQSTNEAKETELVIQMQLNLFGSVLCYSSKIMAPHVETKEQEEISIQIWILFLVVSLRNKMGFRCIEHAFTGSQRTQLAFIFILFSNVCMIFCISQMLQNLAVLVM